MLSFLLASVGVMGAQQPEQGMKPVAHGQSAMVSTSHPDVTKTALDVLRKGGNAVDAAIAAMLYQHVVEPQMSTPAGGFGALVYDVKTNRAYYLDAELDHTHGAPVGRTLGGPSNVPETSGLRIAVPGTVAGLKALADRFGSMPWADYFGPAIEVAENGFPMYSFLFGEMSDAALTRLGVYPSGRATFFKPDGFIPRVGEIWKRPAMAATLRRIAAEGPDYFYRGEWAHHFVDAVHDIGGRVTLEEMAAYEPRWREPLQSTYLGNVILGSPPPATGGPLIEMTLNVLEHVDLKAYGHYARSSKALALMRRVIGSVESDVTDYIADPISYDVPIDVLLSNDYAAAKARLIEASWPKVNLASGAPVLSSGNVPEHDPHYTDTNHIVVADAQGNWISLTHTVYGTTFGTGLVVDGLGLNSGNAFPGVNVGDGRRVVAPLPPTFVMKDGRPWVALGSPGLSNRAVAITLVNFLGYGMSIEEAVDAPRFDGFAPGTPFRVETRIPDAVRDGLRAYGITVVPQPPYNWHFGSIQVVLRDPATGRLTGVADARRGGYADGY
jgi:gamma-glutamyltranspeptidase/glutathione hydrolase